MDLTNGRMELCWATPVYHISYSDTDQLNKELKLTILEHEAALTADKKDTLLFNSFSSMRNEQKLLAWEVNCITALQTLIQPAIIHYLEQNYPQFAGHYTVEAWANIHRYGDWHGSHAHYSGGNEIASGVYWVNIPAEMAADESMGGRLILFDPRGPFFHERKKIILTPQAGNMVIFPAWLQHEVTPAKSTEPRISIAFDIKRI